MKILFQGEIEVNKSIRRWFVFFGYILKILNYCNDVFENDKKFEVVVSYRFFGIDLMKFVIREEGLA